MLKGFPQCKKAVIKTFHNSACHRDFPTAHDSQRQFLRRDNSLISSLLSWSPVPAMCATSSRRCWSRLWAAAPLDSPEGMRLVMPVYHWSDLFIIPKTGGAVTCSCVLLYENLKGVETRLLSQWPGEHMCSELAFDVIVSQAQKRNGRSMRKKSFVWGWPDTASAAQTWWDHLGLAHSHSRVCPSFRCLVEFLQHLARQDLM